MSNQHNEKEFEKIIQEVETLDEKGELEQENIFENGRITI